MGVIYTTEQVFLGSDTFEHEQAELMSVKEVADFILTHESGFIRYDDGTPLLEFFDRELHDCTDMEFKYELMRELRKGEGFEERYLLPKSHGRRNHTKNDLL